MRYNLKILHEGDFLPREFKNDNLDIALNVNGDVFSGEIGIYKNGRRSMYSIEGEFGKNGGDKRVFLMNICKETRPNFNFVYLMEKKNIGDAVSGDYVGLVYELCVGKREVFDDIIIRLKHTIEVDSRGRRSNIKGFKVGANLTSMR